MLILTLPHFIVTQENIIMNIFQSYLTIIPKISSWQICQNFRMSLTKCKYIVIRFSAKLSPCRTFTWMEPCCCTFNIIILHKDTSTTLLKILEEINVMRSMYP